MAAQAAREVRLAAADVVLDNSGTAGGAAGRGGPAVGGPAGTRLRRTSATAAVAPRTGGPVLRGRTTRLGGARRPAGRAARGGRPGRTSWPWTTSAPRRFPDWTPRTSSTSSSRSRTWRPRTGSRRCWRRPVSRAGPGILLDNPKPDPPGPGRLGQAPARQRGPRPAREPPRPRRRLAGLAVCPVLPGLAARTTPAARRDYAGREAPGRRRCTRRTSPPPGTPRTRRPGSRSTPRPDGSVGAAHRLAAAVVRIRPVPSRTGTAQS